MSIEWDKTARSYIHAQASVSRDLTHEILHSEEGTVPITLFCVARYYTIIYDSFNLLTKLLTVNNYVKKGK